MKKKYTCEIDAQVQALVQLIYDPKLYDKTLQQLKIDSNRLPLGKLSLNQLDKAYQIIGYLSNNLEQLDSKQLIKLSSQFYTIIPYASGMSAPPLIDDVSKIEEKIEQLKALDEMIVAAEKMLNPKISNIDEKYFSLHCGLQTVTNSKELNMIVDYAKNTSASTHHFNIRVKNVFKVCRDGEDNRFDKFIGSPNRQLLWHGSRLANFVGILSKGLRINPSNVIKTGSMFGNGLYFSNTASKSAQYIYTKKNGIMLLCEVALGKTYELTNAKYVTKLPDGCLSTHGMGMTAPDPKGYITMDDGVIVPMGKLVKKDIVSTLRYDEFIVYDIAQIRIRYLVQIDLI